MKPMLNKAYLFINERQNDNYETLCWCKKGSSIVFIKGYASKELFEQSGMNVYDFYVFKLLKFAVHVIRGNFENNYEAHLLLKLH